MKIFVVGSEYCLENAYLITRIGICMMFLVWLVGLYSLLIQCLPEMESLHIRSRQNHPKIDPNLKIPEVVEWLLPGSLETLKSLFVTNFF